MHSAAPPAPTALASKSRSEIKNTFSHHLERGLQKMNLSTKVDSRRKGNSLRLREKSDGGHSRFNNEYIQDLITFQKQGKVSQICGVVICNGFATSVE